MDVIKKLAEEFKIRISQVGDTVKVKIISIDYEKGKVGLTMKGIK